MQGGVTGVTVQLANTGGQDTIFTVDGGPDILVGPGASTYVFVAVAEDAAYSIPISADSGQWFTNLTGTRDCDQPPPDDPPPPPPPPEP